MRETNSEGQIPAGVSAALGTPCTFLVLSASQMPGARVWAGAGGGIVSELIIPGYFWQHSLDNTRRQGCATVPPALSVGGW